LTVALITTQFVKIELVMTLEAVALTFVSHEFSTVVASICESTTEISTAKSPPTEAFTTEPPCITDLFMLLQIPVDWLAYSVPFIVEPYTHPVSVVVTFVTIADVTLFACPVAVTVTP
jgi:hypothetical protein